MGLEGSLILSKLRDELHEEWNTTNNLPLFCHCSLSEEGRDES
jgi:hypothetical protein